MQEFKPYFFSVLVRMVSFGYFSTKTTSPLPTLKPQLHLRHPVFAIFGITSQLSQRSVVKSKDHIMSEPSLYKPHVEFNKQQLQKQQDVMCLALGLGAGVLGLESLAGVGFYLVGFSLANLSFYLLCCEGKPEFFFLSPLKNIFLDPIPSGIAGYVMMWCLTFALMK